MILRLARGLLRSPVERRLAEYARTADQILAGAPEHRALSQTALRKCALGFRERVKAGMALEDIVVPFFALVREAARRELGQEHVPQQLMAGLAMHDGSIAEMKTGEGKSLAATLVCALHALSRRGVHVATPNDYLAARDAKWMRPVYEALGLSVGLITQEMDDDSRRAAYGCDITYGIASELGFDYLRDNMKFSLAETVQRGHAFGLVDEADAVLLDEASMPLALYGSSSDHSAFYRSVDGIVAGLSSDCYQIDDRRRVMLTDRGYETLEQSLRQASLLKPDSSLHEVESITLLHHSLQALRAHALLRRDRDYLVHDGEIVIIDRLTGRMMPGRHYDEGLQQALEAKEGCEIGEETRTLASITVQTFFRQYEKLAGMTGTAAGEAEEYRQVYGLEVIPIPTHRPLIRRDAQVLHATRDGKLRAILDEVESARSRQQPVLIGASSIEHSEALATLLETHGWVRNGDPADKGFTVLNARHHASEARIIAQAGMPGAVTIATAMAGRGTDIRLGGTPDNPALRDRAIAAGGLLVIGTEHSPHRRFDAQLRGRAGRQGDPGRSVVHASIEDDLLKDTKLAMAVTGGNQIKPVVAHRLVAVAQRRREAHSFDERIALLRFEQVIHRQRASVYDQRRTIRGTEDCVSMAARLRNDTIDDLMTRLAPAAGRWATGRLDAMVRSILTLDVPIKQPSRNQEADAAALRERISKTAEDWMNGKVKAFGRDIINDVLRRIMMALLDELWAEQLARLEHLKRMIADRRLSPQKAHADFAIEAFALFEVMMRDFRHEVTAHVMRLGKTQF